MACFHPMKAFYAMFKNSKTGKYPILLGRKQFDGQYTFPRGIDPTRPLEVRCNQCVGCRLDISKVWAMRISHEASLYKNNCFITLTYDDDHLPTVHGVDGAVYGSTLLKSEVPAFMKRLRERFVPKCPYPKDHPKRDEWIHENGIRFYYAGEYGEKFGRPHYHLCLFNFKPPDLKRGKRRGKHMYYESDIISELWQNKGMAVIGNLTFDSAAYTARYIMKKINGELAEDHYSIVDIDTGEILGQREPEFTNMSRNGGIGLKWFEKHYKEVYPRDSVIVKGFEQKPPKYYDNKYELMFPDEFKLLQDRRLRALMNNAENNTPERLAIREKILKAKFKKFKRRYEV